MKATYDFDADDEQARVAYYMNLFYQVLPRRVNHDNMWEESFSLVLPEWRHTLSYGHVVAPGTKKTQYQVDSAGQVAAWRFGNILDSIMTPSGPCWSYVRASNKDLMKDPAVAEYFSTVTEALWDARYDEEANFIGEQQRNWLQYGVAGNMAMLPGLDIARRALNYQSLNVGEPYILQNAQGIVDGYIRYFKRDARQAYQLWGETIPQLLKAALEQNSKTLYQFFEIVHPRQDWTPWKPLTPKGFKYTSCYLSIEGACILEEGGYRTFPMAYGRYLQAPEEDYGRGPAQFVLPALKSKNAMKVDYLTQAHRAADPAYLIGDDGLMDFRAHNGAFNYGGMTADGKPLISMVPTGDIKASEDMMNREDQYIDAAFLVDLFQLLYQDAKKGNTQRSAREVVEYASERGVFLAPIVAKNSLYLGKIIDRELDLLSWLGKLPPMPPALREAKGEYKIRYDNPGQRAMRSSETAGTLRTLDAAQQWKNIEPDSTIMDIFDEDAIFRDIGYAEGMPARHFASAAKRSQKAKARQQAQEREQQAKELPGKAAIMKANAIVAKAQTGGNTGGTLSGTPGGGMPLMPGSPGRPGTPGQAQQPGLPGQPGTPGGY